MKSLFQKNSQNLHVVPELHISRGLDYANRRHNGFSEAFKRIKSWCDFGVNYSGETGKTSLCNQPPLLPQGEVGGWLFPGNDFLNRLQGSNYTPNAFWGTTYGTEMSSRSQPCRRLDPQTKKKIHFLTKTSQNGPFWGRVTFRTAPTSHIATGRC